MAEDTKEPTFGFGWIGWSLLFSPLAGGIAVVINPGAFDYPGGSLAGSLFTTLVVSLALGLAVAGITYSVRRRAWERKLEADRKAAREFEQSQKAAAKAAALKAKAEKKASLEKDIEAAADRAVAVFESLPAIIDEIDAFRDDATIQWEAGAFSPFWSDIEQAYQSLGRFNDCVNDLRHLARTYGSSVVTMSEEFGSTGWPPFPVDINAVAVTEVAEERAKNIHGLVYDAQRNPTFAIIWEQRRNTSVLIAGFKSLEQAVHGMQASLTASIGHLKEAVTAGLDRVTDAVEASQQAVTDGLASTRDAISTASKTAEASARNQSSQMSALTNRVSSATWLLEDQRMRELGWR